jgi:hypothetical protein
VTCEWRLLDTKVLAPGTLTLVDLMICCSLIASAICLQQNTAEIWDSPGLILLTPLLTKPYLISGMVEVLGTVF